ncbi:MAG: aromatic ring-hydroxylating dioxygenase subunit alpha, partial [Chrysiogenetes bacterium]|nr:aromatic ring-hydroxylating dioxygenase subunit alpha [Chrysiogenetes bacterium]
MPMPIPPKPTRAQQLLPKECYFDPEWFEREHRELFSRSWTFACVVQDIPNPGDYRAVQVNRYPMVVIRGKDGEVKAYHNTCRHRGTKLFEDDQKGNCRHGIVCPYHAWTYNLDGTLRGAPAMSLNESFCKDDYRLPGVRCEEWQGWVFISLDPGAPPVAEGLAEVEALIGDYGMGDYVETFFETHVWDTNWKVLAENFMESYHLPVCHAGTIGGLSRLED